ncbi:MAG: ATP-dependent RNA helicase HrpA [Desulfobacterales bacterium]|nr:ATP-dependent RNA helicase HrpA [Desulfobacterales bacterium]
MPVPIPYPDDLPIVAQKEKIIKAVDEHQVIIVSGDTGSGKTTQLPKMCLEAGRGIKKTIGCTQPRRLAATAMAARLAEELEPAGCSGLVGYKIRFQDRTSSRTRIKFMTDGILLAETRQHKKLGAYDTLIIDEAHERSLNIDFLLGYLKQLLAHRKDLKLIITSATIDTEKFSRHFNNAPVIQVSGRAHPVEVRYQPREKDGEELTPVDLAVAAIAKLRCQDRPGDILVFMPTERDIRETMDTLAGKLKDPSGRTGSGPWSNQPLILPLFGRLHPRDQQRIFRPARVEKIVIATNVAETSITVPGIRYVIDTGLARIPMYSPRARTMRMPVAPISRAGCDQRKGRCGRVGPGICIRLYGEDEYKGRPEFTLPEIKRSNLAEVILRMLFHQLGDPGEFPFIDPPARRAIRDGYTLLAELGAIRTEGCRHYLTARGRLMARLPIGPRLARQLIEAQERNALREVQIIVAALAGQDPRMRPADHETEADQAHQRFRVEGSDFLSYLSIWEAFHAVARKKSRNQARKFCKTHFLSYQRMREWQDIHDQPSAILIDEGFEYNRRPAPFDAVHQAILSGYLRNIGLKKAKNIYLGAQDKELMIFPGSSQFNSAGSWIVAAELVETSRLFARTVANINPDWLEPIAGDLCRSSYSRPRWEKKSGQVVADEKVTLFGLVLVAGRKVNYKKVGPTARAEAHAIFIHDALVKGELGGRFPFFEHNGKLMAELEEMENRLRLRGVMVDDQTVFEFYHQRLPDICDRQGLNRVIKEKGDDFLRMNRDDLVKELPDRDRLEQFPKSMVLGDLKLALKYRFEPGTAEDGVTVSLPVDLVGRIDPALFDRPVPGLLVEKITCLLKGLPKAIRRQLIPIPETAAGLAAGISASQGPLLPALEKAIGKEYRLRIDRRDWPGPDTLPPHLRTRFELVDQRGKVLKSSRSLRDLSDRDRLSTATRAVDLIPAALRRQWERDNITEWDFAELPAEIPISDQQEKLLGFAYPALVEEENRTVAIRLAGDREQSCRLTRQGTLALYRRWFPKQFTALKKECRAFLDQKTGWRLLEGLADRKQFLEELFRFVLVEIFSCRNGLIPNEKKFIQQIEKVKENGMYLLANRLLDRVRQVLTERRTTLDLIKKYQPALPGPVAGHDLDFHAHLARILPSDFLRTRSEARIINAIRYCKGLQIRVERARLDPRKDAAKASRLTLFVARLREIESGRRDSSPECAARLAEFEEMIEEFRISLFAPELKTAYPVSAKRLEKKWQELDRACR